MDELIALSSYVSRVVPLPAQTAADALDAALAGLCPELVHGGPALVGLGRCALAIARVEPDMGEPVLRSLSGTLRTASGWPAARVRLELTPWDDHRTELGMGLERRGAASLRRYHDLAAGALRRLAHEMEFCAFTQRTPAVPAPLT